MKSSHPLVSPSAWTSPVYFTPFVGERYDEGLVSGVRVLLLGESHYGVASEEPGFGSDCTLYNFEGYTDETCDIDHQHQFFQKLPRIVTRNLAVTQLESAEAWRRIAFSNFVQEFVGANARMRPTPGQWRQGQAALTVLIERLQPNVVLVLGAQLWDNITEGRKSGEPKIHADRRDREIWLIPNGNGYARSSWIYHPSTNYESVASAIGVFAELINRAAIGDPLPLDDESTRPDAARVKIAEAPDA